MQDPEWWHVNYTTPATPDSEEIESDEEEDDEGELDSTGRLFIALITNETPPENSITDNPGFPLPGLDDQLEDLPAQPPSDPKILKRTQAAVAKVTLHFLCISTPNTTFIFHSITQLYQHRNRPKR